MARLVEGKAHLNRERILAVATTAFSKSGYSAVSIRDIARTTKLPLGSHYNYFEDKLSLFKAVIDRAANVFMAPENEVIQYFLNSKFPDDLPDLARAIKLSIERHESYFRLMYVDVIEFEGAHIRDAFSNLESKFAMVLKGRFKKMGIKRGNTKPAFAMVTIYLTFYQYFLMSKLFGATKIFDQKSESKVIEELVDLFQNGMAKSWQ